MTINGTPAVILRYDREQDREQFEDLFGRDFNIQAFGTDQAALDYLAQGSPTVSGADTVNNPAKLSAIFILSHHTRGYPEPALLARTRDYHPHVLKILMSDVIELDLLVSLLDQQLVDRCFEQPINPDLIRSHVLMAALTLDKAPPTHSQELVDRSNKTAVLIVDDEPSATRYLARQLEILQDDFRVLCARNADEALRLVQDEAGAVAVVMTDQRMPGMHGKELLDELKQSHPAIVRILTSAWGEVDVALGAVNEGRIYRYRQKPWQAQELLTLFRQALAHHQQLVTERDCSRTRTEQQFAELRQQRYARLMAELSGSETPVVGELIAARFLDLLQTIKTLPANQSHLRASRETTLEQDLERDFGQLVRKQLETLTPAVHPPLTRQQVESVRAATAGQGPGNLPPANTPLALLWQSLNTLLSASGMESSQISIIQHDESFIITTDDALRMYSHLLAPITRLSQPLLEQQSALLLICACTHMLGGDIAAQGGKQMFRLTLQFTAGSQAQ